MNGRGSYTPVRKTDAGPDSFRDRFMWGKIATYVCLEQ